MAISTALTARLGIEHPVLLAAMDTIADARLTLAVSQAGGFGILGGGYGNEAWLRRELAIVSQARATHGTRFGVGFITWSVARQPELVDIALAAKPDALWLSFGDAGAFAARARAAGIPVIAQVQSVAMAREVVEQGADIVVAQGTEAGGHGSARGTFALVPAIADAIGDRAIVVAAGGVADGRGLAAAMMLGAAGVVLGTRFYASEEAAGHAKAKARIVEMTGDDTVRGLVFDLARNNVWPAPFTGRCLNNKFAREWTGREIELMQHHKTEGERYMKAQTAGDFDVAAVIAGESAGLIDQVLPAGEIVRRLARDAEALMGGGPLGTNAVSAASRARLNG